MLTTLPELIVPDRDKNRGVVWEESIILLPHKVRFVFLSATIPNSKEFCGWIAKTHHQPCHVVYTDYRLGGVSAFLSAIDHESSDFIVIFCRGDLDQRA